MLRWLTAFALAALMLLLAAPALAQPGHKARYSMSLELTDAYWRNTGVQTDGDFMPDGFTIPPVTGVLYLTADRVRMDINSGGSAGVVTTLIDLPNRNVYLLSHAKKTAWRTALSGATGSEIPIFNLEQMASRWEQSFAQLNAREGVSTRQLGSKKVNGQRCRGISVSCDIGRLIEADEIAVLPGTPGLRRPKGKWQGTFWVAEDLGLPMKMSSSFAGIEMSWQIAGVEAWDVPDAFMSIPPGYLVRDGEDPTAAPTRSV